jgi:hypothetical protein
MMHRATTHPGYRDGSSFVFSSATSSSHKTAQAARSSKPLTEDPTQEQSKPKPPSHTNMSGCKLFRSKGYFEITDTGYRTSQGTEHLEISNTSGYMRDRDMFPWWGLDINEKHYKLGIPHVVAMTYCMFNHLAVSKCLHDKRLPCSLPSRR